MPRGRQLNSPPKYSATLRHPTRVSLRSAIPKLHHFPLLSAEALALLGPAWGCAEVFPLVGIRLGMATWVFSVLVMWGQRGPTGTKDAPQGSPPH